MVCSMAGPLFVKHTYVSNILSWILYILDSHDTKQITLEICN